MEAVPLVRDLLQADWGKKPNTRTMYMVSQLMRALQESHADQLGADKVKVLLPLVKELYLFNMAALPSPLVQQRAAFNGQLAYLEFAAAADTEVWQTAFN